MKPYKQAAENPAGNDNPYPGLRPYQEDEQNRFFGREQEIHVLTDKILANRLTLLVAASGVGKSSLLQAGVVPVLRAGGRLDLVYHKDWAVKPSRDLKENIIKHYISRQRINPDYNADLEQPLDQFLRVHTLLGQGTLVILLDQFEEFFYYQRFSKQRLEFIQELAAAIRDTEAPTVFVFSMREDFAMEMEAFKTWLPGIFDNIYRIERLSLEAAEQAIIRPVAALGFEYQPELIKQLLEELGQRERRERFDLKRTEQQQEAPPLVEPPYLQIVCRELWLHAKNAPDRKITTHHYKDLGRAGGILERYFKSKMAELLNDKQRRLASRAFDYLVSQHGAKMSYPLEELAKKLRGENFASRAFDYLVSQHSARITYPLEELAKKIRGENRASRAFDYLVSQHRAKIAYPLEELSKKLRGENQAALQQTLDLLQSAVILRRLQRQGQLWYELYHDIFAKYIAAWNQDYKNRQMWKRVARWVFGIIVVIGGLYVVYDSWENYSHRHLRLGKETVSDRVELYKGEIDSRDLFNQQGFIFETDYQRQAIEADERFETAAIAELNRDRQMQIKLLPLKNRFIEYANAGLLGKKEDTAPAAETVAAALRKDNELIKILFQGLPEIRMQWSVNLLDELYQLTLDKQRKENKENPNRAVEIAEVLTSINAQATTVPLLIKLLGDSNAYVRVKAIKRLAAIKAETAVPDLISVLADSDKTVCDEAVQALTEINSKTAIPGLVQLLGTSEADVRNRIVRVLGQMKIEDAENQLIKLLTNSHADVRSSAVQVLGDMKNIEATVVDKVLEDTNADVRNSAVQALGKRKIEDAVVDKLILRLKDDDATVQSSAIQALRDMKAKKAIPNLIQLLEDEEKATVLSEAVQADEKKATALGKAVEALGDMEAQDAVQVLSQLLKHSDADMRSKIIQALVKIKAEAAVPKLIPLLKHSGMRSEVVQALGEIKAEAAVPELIPLLEDSDETVCDKAKQALVEINSKTAVPGLIKLLEHDDADVRLRAVGVLGEMKAEAAVDKLIKRLDDRDPEVFSSVAKVLGEMKAEAAVDKLIKRLKDRKVYDSAEQALGEIKAETAIPKLELLLNYRIPEVRISVVTVLGNMKTDAAVSKLIELLKNNDAVVRLGAVQTLKKIKDVINTVSIVSGLIKRLAEDDDAAVRGEAVQFLGELKAGEAAVCALIQRLRQDNAKDVRKYAAEALGRMKTTEAVPDLIKLLEDKYEDVRSSAVKALGEMEAKDAVPDLIQLLRQDNDKDVREYAAEALGRMKTTEAVPDLIELLKDKDEYVRRSAVQALGEMEAKDAVPGLIRRLEDDDSVVRQYAVEALGRMKIAKAVPWLIQRLKDDDSNVRDNAVDVLGEMKIEAIVDKSSVDKLIQLLDDNESYVRISAMQVLGKMKIEAAVPRLIQLLDDSEVSTSAAQALGELKAEAAIPRLIQLLDDSDLRSSAVQALSELKAEAAIPGLIRLLDDSSYYGSYYEGIQVVQVLGVMKAKITIPKLITLLETTDSNADMQQAAAVALSRMNANTPELTTWQNKQLTKLAEKINTGSAYERLSSVTTLGAIHNKAAVTLLVGLLKDIDTDVVKNATESLGAIGEYHPEWLQPYTQQILQFTANPDTDIQTTAITALGQFISFNGKTKATDFVDYEQTIIEGLIAIAKDSQQQSHIRITAVDALGSSENPQAAKALLSLLQVEKLDGLHFSITYWLGHIAYKPALPVLKEHLENLDQAKHKWRTEVRDAKFLENEKSSDDVKFSDNAKLCDSNPQQAISNHAQKDKSWQYEACSYQTAYAIARIAPETDGIPLLEHALYPVRQAAIQALAERADGNLIEKLLKYHKEFNPEKLPFPRPYAVYRALDKALFKVEVTGNPYDLNLLIRLKGEQITTTMKTQERAINERFDWTITELSQRLKTANTP